MNEYIHIFKEMFLELLLNYGAIFFIRLEKKMMWFQRGSIMWFNSFFMMEFYSVFLLLRMGKGADCLNLSMGTYFMQMFAVKSFLCLSLTLSFWAFLLDVLLRS